MPLEHLLQINVATLVVLGSLLLGMGQGNTVVPLLAVASAGISVVFTDILCWFRLNTMLANVAGVGVVVVCLADFFEYRHKEEQLIAVANLLVYLQMVLLFQKKNNRLYGHLLVLSLLQVVVASALGLDLQFGLMLILYMFTALSALCFFFFHREMARYGTATSERRVCSSETNGAQAPFGTLVVGNQQRTMQTGVTYENLTSAMTMRSLVNCILTMGLSTLVMAVGLFFAIPRLSTSQWSSQGSDSQVLGFSQEVTLDEVGQLTQSPVRVMRISFFDQQAGRPYMIAGEPYFRGTALWHYSHDGRKGRWGQSNLQPWQESVALRWPPNGVKPVRQEIVLEPRRDKSLFAVYPSYRTTETPPDIRYDLKQRQLIHQHNNEDLMRRGQFRYKLLTTAFISGWQDPIVPHSNRQEHADDIQLLERELRALLAVDLARFPKLKQLADEIVHSAETQNSDRFATARSLEAHFRNSGLYEYTLDFSTAQEHRDSDLDPIEDFVANHRSGHCEYFASALVMMLRCQGIPARLVVGYLGGDYNAIGRYYQIRQEHAHVWVEAYLEPDQVPQAYANANTVSRSGAWLRLDPTPPGDDPFPVTADQGFLIRIGQWAEYTQFLWSEYIVELNSERQYKSIYRPLVERTEQTLHMLFGRDTWGRLFDAIRTGRWFNWRAGLTTSAVLLVLAGIYRLVRDPLQQVFDVFRSRRRPVSAGRRIRVGFYSRLESLLARHGMRRATGQTPREFAVEIGGQLADHPAGQGTASLPCRLVDIFYRIRFGGQTLDAEEVHEANRAVAELERALSGIDEHGGGTVGPWNRGTAGRKR